MGNVTDTPSGVKAFRDRIRLPRKLKLLPGLKWSGSLTVRTYDVGPTTHRWLVDFDAINPDMPEGTERWIGDRTVLTTKQILAWTGVDIEKERVHEPR